jgi:hypothetical protein
MKMDWIMFIHNFYFFNLKYIKLFIFADWVF